MHFAYFQQGPAAVFSGILQSRQTRKRKRFCVRTFKKRQVDYFTVSWRQFSLSAMFMLAVVFNQFTLTKLLRPNLPHFLSQVFMGIFLSDARNCRVSENSSKHKNNEKEKFS